MGYTIEFNLPVEKANILLSALMTNFTSMNHFSIYRGHSLTGDNDEYEILNVSLSSENYQLIQEIAKINEQPAEPKPDETKDEQSDLSELVEIYKTIINTTAEHKQAQKRIINELEKRGFEVLPVQQPMENSEISDLIQQIRITQPSEKLEKTQEQLQNS